VDESRTKSDRQGFLGSAVVLGVVVGAIVLALQGRSAQLPPGAGRSQVTLAGSPAAGPEEEVELALEVAVPEAREAPGTPPLDESVAEVDGLLEMRVGAQGQPVPRARVRLYQRNEDGPPLEASAVEPRRRWRLAALAATGDDGRLVLPARPGRYLMAVWAEGFAPLLRDVVRPEGEARTRVELKLAEPVTLSGRTVTEQRAPLPEAVLVLTPYHRPDGVWRLVEAPREERIYGVSDAEGRFHLEGLAPGLYRMEVRLPGQERGEMQVVQVPAEELEWVVRPARPSA
jgi:hypothetical protein